MATNENTASICEEAIFSPLSFTLLIALGCMIFVILEKPTLNNNNIRHTFIPPPTEPEHAPMKATINIKNPTDPPKAERGSIVNPVVVTIEIV